MRTTLGTFVSLDDYNKLREELAVAEAEVTRLRSILPPGGNRAEGGVSEASWSVHAEKVTGERDTWKERAEKAEAELAELKEPRSPLGYCVLDEYRNLDSQFMPRLKESAMVCVAGNKLGIEVARKRVVPFYIQPQQSAVPLDAEHKKILRDIAIWLDKQHGYNNWARVIRVAVGDLPPQFPAGGKIMGDWVARYATEFELYGTPSEELNRKELLATVGWLNHQLELERQNHASSLELQKAMRGRFKTRKEVG